MTDGGICLRRQGPEYYHPIIPSFCVPQDADRERRDSGPSERGVHHSSWLTFKSWEDGDDEDSEGGDGSLDESTPLALPSIKLNLYTPQINLEALTANCAKGVLLLTYLLFILCVIVTVESLVGTCVDNASY